MSPGLAFPLAPNGTKWSIRKVLATPGPRLRVSSFIFISLDFFTSCFYSFFCHQFLEIPSLKEEELVCYKQTRVPFSLRQ